ncbi:type II toxin-antitoxin system PemK/MazF family toxin [Mongoliimonas terrestris]|uniref:type II toxin-antitoxin system PemK/MazF family toxin n=1 Tax=Mongoliimonas terrestris TaxID=1709001 RepID=UPI0009499139|nr:type II toxin-antitoxin system PemK/MazF family toxin [Mongoliimonas terrestris]
MTITVHPDPGTIVRVDLAEGFRPPEMVKRRPAVVLSPPIVGRPQLCTILPLSSTEPRPILPHHLRIELDPCLPAPYDDRVMWLKGDIVLTVAFHRLRYLFSHWANGQRRYDIRRLEAPVFSAVQSCVRSGLGLAD